LKRGLSIRADLGNNSAKVEVPTLQV